jgi:uncharacterized protein
VGLKVDKFFDRLILTVLTVLAIAFIGLAMVDSWGNPQAETRLDLLQTDLMLKVSEWQSDRPQEIQVLKDLLVGKDSRAIYEQALEAYERAVKSNQTNQIEPAKNPKTSELELINDLKIHVGLLQAYLGKNQAAIATWDQALPNRPHTVV